MNKNKNKSKNHNHKIKIKNKNKNHNININNKNNNSSNNNNKNKLNSNNNNKNNKNKNEITKKQEQTSNTNINNKNKNENENTINNSKFLEDLDAAQEDLVLNSQASCKTLSLTFNHLGCFGVRSCPWHSIILDATLEKLVFNLEHLGWYALRPCRWIIATCSRQPLAATCSHLQPLAPTGECWEFSGVFRRRILQILREKAASGNWTKWLQVAASGCWEQVAASGCFCRIQNTRHLHALWLLLLLYIYIYEYIYIYIHIYIYIYVYYDINSIVFLGPHSSSFIVVGWSGVSPVVRDGSAVLL